MNYCAITKDDMLNGDGIRVVLWVAGCPHNCKGCHNKHTHNKDAGVLFTEETKQEIFNELDKDYISGITFSGGDPLAYYNRDVVSDFAIEIKTKYPNKNIWLYTGYTYNEVKDLEVIKYLDCLCDGKYIEEYRDVEKHWVGSSNQNVLRLT